MIYLLSVSNPAELTDDFRRIYEVAFPDDERRDWHQFAELLLNPCFSMNKVFFHDELIGILNYWKLDSFYFIEHFAISEAERGKGLGSLVISQFLRELSNVVLEVEEPYSEMARRRIEFYKRFDFCTLEGDYYQPPYSTAKNSIKMLLMNYSNQSQSTDFNFAKKQIYQTVYKITE